MIETFIHFIKQDIIQFHDDLEKNFILSPGIRDMALLESAVNAPFQTFMGQDLYPSVFDKAAQLCYGLANNHPFVDGNKRTALHSMLVYLEINDIQIDYKQEEMEDLIIRVSSGQLKSSELSLLLSKMPLRQ